MIFLALIKAFDNRKKTPFNTFNLILLPKVPKRNYEIRTVGGESASNNHTAFAREREKRRKKDREKEFCQAAKQAYSPCQPPSFTGNYRN